MKYLQQWRQFEDGQSPGLRMPILWLGCPAPRSCSSSVPTLAGGNPFSSDRDLTELQNSEVREPRLVIFEF